MKKYISAIVIIPCAVAAALIFSRVFSGQVILSQGVAVGNFSFRWYGMILAAAVLIGYAVARRNSWRFGISGEEVDDVSFWLVIVSVASARAYYVFSMWPYFLQEPKEILQIWHGGLSIYGALIGGGIFLYFYSRKKIYSPSQLFDLAALSLPLAQAFGRLGNFFNYEAFGLPTDLPWKMFVPEPFRPEQFASARYFHPAFLYELLWNVLVFGLLLLLRGRVKKGVVALSYIGLYSLGRFFIEPLRLDSVIVGNSYRLDQLIAFAAVISAMILTLIVYGKDKQVKPD